ncbi:MAG: MbnP family protein [Bacteroidota bacterium]
MRVLLFFLLITGIIHAQVPTKRLLNFRVCYGNTQTLVVDSFYKLHQSDSIQIEELKFYVSGIRLWNGTKQVWKEDQSFHLVDITQPSSMQVSLAVPANLAFNYITFTLGIDSVTNVSGALGGDLDPTKGMYWTWQSGYINMKLEGTSNLCTTRNHTFQYHFGGYQYPYHVWQEVKLQVNKEQPLHVVFDVKKLMEQLDLVKQPEMMSPCRDAVLLSQQMVQFFKTEEK